jgi:hypothetical protein
VMRSAWAEVDDRQRAGSGGRGENQISSTKCRGRLREITAQKKLMHVGRISAGVSRLPVMPAAPTPLLST